MVRVVLVEDKQLFLDGTIALLEKEEKIKIVGTAMNYEQAVKQVQENQPDVVLVDTDMPNDSGMKVISFIKQNHPGIKVLVVTAVMKEDHVIRALCHDVEGFLVTCQFAGKLVDTILEISNGETMISGDAARYLAKYIRDLSVDEKAIVAKRLEQTGVDLTKREVDIAYLLMQGYSNQQIAQKLFIGEGTVKNYISDLYHKLKIRNRPRAIAYLRQLMDGIYW